MGSLNQSVLIQKIHDAARKITLEYYPSPKIDDYEFVEMLMVKGAKISTDVYLDEIRKEREHDDSKEKELSKER